MTVRIELPVNIEPQSVDPEAQTFVDEQVESLAATDVGEVELSSEEVDERFDEICSQLDEDTPEDVKDDIGETTFGKQDGGVDRSHRHFI